MSKKSENSSTQTGDPLYQQFAEGKHIIPREGSPGGGNGRGFKGDPMGEQPALAAESDETFPWGPLYCEDSTVNKKIIYTT